jgi:transposase
MKSPGKPSLRRDVERLFWREIAKGLSSEDAAAAVGVSQAAGTRWFRERGGMPTFMTSPVTGRYLSFEEREVMALRKAQGAGVREIAREVQRHRRPSPASCAATPPPAAGSSSTGPRWPSGRPS